MKHFFILFAFAFASVLLFLTARSYLAPTRSATAMTEKEKSPFPAPHVFEKKAKELANWQRPDGKIRIGLQVGHWKTQEVPPELSALHDSTGARGGGKMEWQVNYAIATRVATELRKFGFLVDILPTTIPEGYRADVFVAIHADNDPKRSGKSGFKISGSWRDMSGKAEMLTKIMQQEYKKATGMHIDPYITNNMRGYYAFSWWNFKHAIHPMTPAVIVETGFLDNPEDRKIILSHPDISSIGITNGIIRFLYSVAATSSSTNNS